MTDTISSDAAFEAHLASWPDMPAWLADMKRDAWKRFKELPTPERRLEAWRFARTEDLVLEAFPLVPPAKPEGAEPSPVVECAGCLDFVDGEYIGGRAVDGELLRRGLIFMPLRRAIAEHEALVREHLFERMPDLGSEKYQALHVAMFSDGVFVRVPRGMEIALPLAALHESKAGTPLFPHSLVVADEGASVDFLEIFRSQDGAPKTFVCAATDLLAKRDARIRRRTVQDWNRDSLAFHLDCSTAGDSSLVDVIGVNLGAAHLRGEQHGRIAGRGADVRMHSLCLATGKQQMDQRTLQTHDAPDGKSDLLYKNVLLDEARTIFSGLIKVSPVAQRTDAYQTNRNLLLSSEAEANSLPGLEILANDVKCSHGASSSQLDPDQLFYLAARGIDKRSAQRLLVFGFFEEVLEKIGSEPLAEYIRGILQSRFGG